MRQKVLFFIILIILFFVGLFIGSKNTTKESFKEGFDETFKKSFRKNFVFSCIGKEKSQEIIDLCNCSADEALNQLTVRELQNVFSARKFIQEQILPKCANDLGMEI